MNIVVAMEKSRNRLEWTVGTSGIMTHCDECGITVHETLFWFFQREPTSL